MGNREDSKRMLPQLMEEEAIGSFKVTIIYIIIHSIIFLININGVVKKFNNGVINGDFLINGPQGLLLH